MDLLEIDLNIIPKVYAQSSSSSSSSVSSSSSSADAIAQPTFGELNINGGGQTVASVALTADSTNTQIGNTVKVEVQINTNTFTINEYDIIITYDATKFTVLDADQTLTGTQVEFLDTVFQVDGTNNTADNGKITLIAKTASGNALQVNRKVARITFQAQTTGTSNITLASGGSGTKLINQNGVAIAANLNTVTINTTTTTSSSTISSSSSVSTTSSTVSSSSSSAEEVPLPDTGVPEDLATAVPILMGILLLALGINLAKVRKRNTHA